MNKKESEQTKLAAIASVLVGFVVIVAFLIGYNAGRMGGPGLHFNVKGQTAGGIKVSNFDGVAVKGEENAPVTITEWSDFQCPFCGRFYSDTLGQIEENYIKTGKVKLVYKDFPLSFHPMAQKSAEAGKCALEQDAQKFWALHDTIFENQASLSVENLKLWAAQVGLDSDEFNDCLDSGSMASVVAAEMREGQNSGIQGTPGFLVGDQLVSGAQPYAVFQQAIEAQLAAQ